MKEAMTDYTKLTGQELIGAYNAMLSLPIAITNLEERQRKPVQKWESIATGIARCEALASRLRAWSGTDEVAKKPRVKKEKIVKEQRTTLKSKVVATLLLNMNIFVSSEDLIHAAYGEQNTTNLRGGLENILRGVTKDIKGANYELRSEKGKRFGFFDKNETQG